MKDDGGLRILLVPEGTGRTRTIRLSARLVRALFATGVLVAVLLVIVTASWWVLAARARRVGELEAELTILREERSRVEALAQQFEEVEAQYGQLRALFSADSLRAEDGVWLPPPGGAGGGDGDREGAEGESLPTSWPLTEPGFLTQPLVDAARGQHPGIDVAIPTGSYIRSAGAGTVAEVGDDPTYGRFVIVEHAEGYTTRYAHASLILVEPGEAVRRDEVIALTGSTGRSTAPHLHFEIRKAGEVVDPLSLVSPP